MINTQYVDKYEPKTVNEEIVNEEVVSEEPLFGVVTNCARLNIRKSPDVNGVVICTVPAGTSLMIDPSNSTDEWFSVCNNVGIEGFCVKKYVDVRE